MVSGALVLIHKRDQCFSVSSLLLCGLWLVVKIAHSEYQC